MDDENRYIQQRRDKLARLREQGQAYPNHFERKDFAAAIHLSYDANSKQELVNWSNKSFVPRTRVKTNSRSSKDLLREL